jgi:large subunit ribosomal protein L24
LILVRWGVKAVQIKKGDMVIVKAGKELGKTGKVLHVFTERDRALVEKINIVKKHQRPTQQNQKGGIIEVENPLHVSNLMFLCGKCEKGVRIGKKRLEDGRKVRICKKCGEEI